MTAVGTPGPVLDEAVLQAIPRQRRASGRTRILDRLRLPERWDWLLLLTLTTVVAFTNVSSAPAFQDDEGTYTFQARAVWDGALAPYTYWYDHPPLGWIQLALLGWVPQLMDVGGSAVGAMRHVVAGYLTVNALLLYALGRRLGFRRLFAGLAVVFFVLSPLSLELGRQVFIDNIAMPWILGSFLLALSPTHNLAAHIGAGVCFSIGVLSKETMAIYGPALLYVVWRNSHRQTRSFSILGFLTVGGLVLAAYPLMALLKGELWAREGRSTLWDALVFQFVGREGSGYLWESGSAKAELVSGWAYFDAYLLYGGLAAAAVMLLRRRTRWIGLAIACFATPVLATAGYTPAMYIVAVLPFLSLAIAAFADEAWGWASASRRARRRLLVQASTGLLIVGALWQVSMPSWRLHNTATLTEDKNAEWVATVEWVKQHVGRDQVVVVPPSMWQDLRDAGWPDEWSVISAEKVDLDPSEFGRVYPDGWRALDYVVLNPTVQANLDYLDLRQLRTAVEHGTPVASFGATRVLRIDGGAAS